MDKIIAQFQQRIFFVMIIAILILAGTIRLWNLGSVPDGLTWDEAAIGYNGYTLITTRRDEWLEKLPLSVRSFGDYKAPLAIYLNGVFTVLLGLKIWVVRLPFALAGIVSVAAFTWLAWELWKSSKWRLVVAMCAGMFIALSPWHILFSRAGFESGIALSLLLLGLVFWHLARSQSGAMHQRVIFVLSGLMMAGSVYAYHSAKITVPIVIVALLWMNRSWIRANMRIASWFILPLIGAGVPLAHDHIFGKAAERSGVLLINQGLSLSQVVSQFLYQLTLYIRPDFLLFGATDTLRHSTGVFGVLTPLTFFLAVASVASFVYALSRKRLRVGYQLQLAVVLIVAGVLPAAMTNSLDPHPNRALLALPGFLLLAVLGLEMLLDWSAKVRKRFVTISIPPRFIVSAVISAELVFSALFLNFYFNSYNARAANDFHPGYIEAMTMSEAYLSGKIDGGAVDQVVFSSRYGQPYIYALFVKKLSPIWYQGGGLVRYLFVDQVGDGDLMRNNTLVVATTEEFVVDTPATHLVRDASGAVQFRLYRTAKIEDVVEEVDEN